MLRFLDVRARNFGSFTNLELSLSDLGLLLVRGVNLDAPLADSNGSGKSMLLEAIVWCLWGQTIRGLKSDEVVHELAGKDCEVILRIEEDGHIYTIRRTRLMSGEKPNNVFFIVDGQDASDKNMKDAQEQIDTLLGLSYDTFCAMMPGAKVKVAELTDAKIKALLESLLQTERFAAAHKLARDWSKELSLELTPLSKEVPALEEQASRLGILADDYEKADKDFENEIKEKTKALKNKRREYGALLKDYQSIIDGRNDLSVRLASLKATRDETGLQIRELEAEFKQFYEQLEETRAAAHRNIAVIAEKLRTTNSLLEELTTLDANCAHCHQTVPEEHKETVKKKLFDDQRLYGAQHKRLETMLESFNAGAKEQQAAKVQVIKEKREALQQTILQVRDLEHKLSSGIKNAELGLARTQAEIAQVDADLSALAFQSSPYEKLLKETALQLKEVESELTKKRARLKQVDRDLEYAAFWVDSFSPQGLRSHLLENVTPYLNERVKYYADLLTDGELCITFHTQSVVGGKLKEKFYIDVQQKHGSGSYKGASDGEKRRADIAIAFALGDLASLRAKKNLPFRFLDEPFENLDESGIQAVVQLLKEQAEKFETVFVITHNDQLKSVFPKELVVQKQNGNSEIVTNDYT